MCQFGVKFGVTVPVFVCMQFFGVIVSWLYITRVEDAIREYGHYQDGLLEDEPRTTKEHGRVATWYNCMPDID